MQGMSERQYAAHAGVSRGAIQKAKAAGRLAFYPDGSIDAAASDARRGATTDPSKQRSAAPPPKMKAVPDTALSAVGDTLRENGLMTPSAAGGTTFLQAKTANEVLKALKKGALFGVCATDVANGDEAEIMTEGVFDLGKLATDVVAQGDPLYWDDGNKRLTITATGNTLVGAAALAAGNGAATVRIRLNGHI